MLLANDPPSMLVPKTKPRDTNSIFYYYLYSVNVPYHLLMIGNPFRIIRNYIYYCFLQITLSEL